MSHDLTEDLSADRPVDRRFLIRGGAVLAGAAGLTAVGAAMAPTAHAADGQTVVLGQANSASSTTSITESGAAPTLSLVNASGPSLKLNPLAENFSGSLAVGEIANTVVGPQIGVDYGGGVEKTYLATGIDLEAQPAPVAFTPERLIDTRVAGDRATIIGSSGSPFDSKGQLKAGAYMDIAISPLAAVTISAVFLNLTAVKPSTGGFLAAYPSGFPVPDTSNVNFQPNVTIANAAFIAVGELAGYYAIRIYVAKASHVIVDLTGVVFGGESATPNAAPAKNPRQALQARRLQRMRSAVAKAANR